MEYKSFFEVALLNTVNPFLTYTMSCIYQRYRSSSICPFIRACMQASTLIGCTVLVRQILVRPCTRALHDLIFVHHSLNWPSWPCNHTLHDSVTTACSSRYVAQWLIAFHKAAPQTDLQCARLRECTCNIYLKPPRARHKHIRHSIFYGTGTSLRNYRQRLTLHAITLSQATMEPLAGGVAPDRTSGDETNTSTIIMQVDRSASYGILFKHNDIQQNSLSVEIF